MGNGRALAQWGLQQGQNVASGLLGGLTGMIFHGYEDRRQLKQQEKLQQIQIEGQRAMSDYNYSKQLQMWKDTNYQAQMEELKKAGLNPALLYGMGGGGGQTTGSGSGGSVQGATAATGQMGIVSQSMQLSLMDAQRKNIEADTKLKNVDADKRAGVDTENVKSQTELTRIHTEIAQVQASVSRQTINEQMEAMKQIVAKGGEENHRKQMENEITENQMQDRINLLHTQALGAIIENEARKQNIEVDKATINKMSEDIKQKWVELAIKNEEKNIRGYEAQLKAKYPGLWNVAGRILNDTGDELGKLFGSPTLSNKNPKK